MDRYLFFADFLGTKERYRETERVKRVRELLEIVVPAYFGPGLTKHDFHVYIISDSLFVTCPRVQPLILPIAKLFRKFLPAQSSAIHLLRGAIAHGKGVATSVIKNSPRIMVIPLLDTSLVEVTTLEKTRPGSRVFIDKASACALRAVPGILTFLYCNCASRCRFIWQVSLLTFGCRGLRMSEF